MNDGVIASLATQQFDRAIAEHLVCVHVVRSACAGLKRIDHKLIAQRAGQDFIGCSFDRLGQLPIQ